MVDFGTTTNFDVISARGEFLGGAFAPGIEISFDALAARAAQLRKVELGQAALGDRHATPSNACRLGIYFGFAGQVGPHRHPDDRRTGRGEGGDRHRRAGAGGVTSASVTPSPTTSQ